MSYSPYYTGGWQTGETGGTPITPAALNHMDSGIGANAAAAAEQAEDISDVNALLGNTSMGTTATTVTGAIKEHSNKIGNTSMGTTAQTLTGAIAEHESDITALNGKTASIEARFGSFLPTNTNIDNLGADDGGMWLYERVAPRTHTGTFPQTDTYGWLIHVPGTSANFGTQIIRSNNLAASSGMFYIRFRVSGTWGNWMKIVATAI